MKSFKLALFFILVTLPSLLLAQGAPSANNVTEPSEACDGTDLNGLSCTSVAAGFKGGTLKCKADRAGYDFSMCIRGGVVSAASCKSSDVQAAVNKAVDGDIVSVPAGTCTWSTPVIIGSYSPASRTTVGKSIVLQGAGIDQTIVIEDMQSNSSAIGLSLQSGKPVRVTGFTFDGAKTKDNYASIGVSGPYGAPLFRIDHCKFQNVTERGIITNVVHGLIDHNIFTRIPFGYSATLISVIGDSRNAWSKAQDQGTASQVYMEDNILIQNIQANGPFDMYEGARYVFRHNKVYGNGLGHHGFDSSTSGIMNFEIYDNTFMNGLPSDSPYLRQFSAVLKSDFTTASPSTGATALATLLSKGVLEEVSATAVRVKDFGAPRPSELTGNVFNRVWNNMHGLFVHGIVFEFRSGSGVIFNNSVSRMSAVTNDTGSYDLFALLRNYRSGDGFITNYGYPFPWDGLHPPQGVCNGTSPVDGNTPGMQGYPCRDQIGRSTNQMLSPVYSWNNNFLGNTGGHLVVGGYALPPPEGAERVTLHIVENRDFYQTPKPSYVPYVYPHPLAQLDQFFAADIPAPPANITFGIK